MHIETATMIMVPYRITNDGLVLNIRSSFLEYIGVNQKVQFDFLLNYSNSRF